MEAIVYEICNGGNYIITNKSQRHKEKSKFTLKSRTAAGEIDFAADFNEEQLAVG